jgi:hypothetical protein
MPATRTITEPARSSADIINEAFNSTPHCVACGQAAGTAATVTAKSGIQPRAVDYAALGGTWSRKE